MDEKHVQTAVTDAAKRDEIRETLLSWFEGNARDLPWRRTRDPWRVLVSEVMLQQIQVKRAVPFYERFLERFPNVEDLADAPLAEAIRVWEDLGRYRRVVYLHKTARIVADEHGGSVPTDPEELVKLPGIGPYTAGAVACFAYERDVAFLDTNMRRVLQRLFFGVETPTERDLLKIAGELVPPGRGWRWNQALMETGALICTARRPACEDCPLRDGCRARSETLSSGWPQPVRRTPTFRYEDSNRYYRGRVLAALREDSRAGGDGLALHEVGRRLKHPFDEDDARWLHAAVESLCKDGLARISPAPRTTGAPMAVAEERAPYGAEPEGSSEERSPHGRPLQRKVSLP